MRQLITQCVVDLIGHLWVDGGQEKGDAAALGELHVQQPYFQPVRAGFLLK